MSKLDNQLWFHAWWAAMAFNGVFLMIDPINKSSHSRHPSLTYYPTFRLLHIQLLHPDPDPTLATVAQGLQQQ